MVTPGEGLLDKPAQVALEDLRDIAADEAAVAAGTGEHRERLPSILCFAQYQNSGALHIQQRADLGENAFGQPLHRFEVEQRRCRLDDDLEPAARLHHALKLLIAT